MLVSNDVSRRSMGFCLTEISHEAIGESSGYEGHACGGSSRMSLVRILVVDDFKQWRDFVRVCIEKRPDIHILGFASDGLEAVQKARDLQPDVVLMDIGLPELNGIQAAERIRQLVSKTKIHFLTGQADPGIVRAAFKARVHRYIIKSSTSQDI